MIYFLSVNARLGTLLVKDRTIRMIRERANEAIQEVSGSTPSAEEVSADRVESPAAAAGFEWKTRIGFLGIPLVCIAFGRDERGKARVAKGFIALGQFAVGGIAISQFGVGIVSVGQFVLGIAALGQLAIGWLTGIGQLAVGTFAVGQFVIGEYGMGQAGWARYLWSPGRTDLEAVAMFEAVKWLFQQEPATVIDAIKFGLKLGKNWVLSVFN